MPILSAAGSLPWQAPSREDGKNEITKSLNYHLDDLAKKVDEAHSQLVKDRKPLTAEALRSKFLGRDFPQKIPQLLEIFRLHNKQMKELIGKEFEENTLKGYNTCLLHLTGFIRDTFKSDDRAIDLLDYNFINDFNHYLKLKCGIRPISAAKLNIPGALITKFRNSKQFVPKHFDH
jgi:hypothetical protein